MNSASPFHRLSELAASKEGAGHWWSQRLSGAALAVLSVCFLGGLVTLDSYHHTQIAAWLGQIHITVCVAFLTVSLAYHSYLGVQVIVEDYVSSLGLRIATLAVLKFMHYLAALAGLFALLRIFFTNA